MEKPQSDEFEDEDIGEPTGTAEDVDLDQVNKELDLAKRRGQKLGEPAWRRLERIREDKRTAELTRFSLDVPAVVITRWASHLADSTNVGSFNVANACNGVFVRVVRTVQY